MGGGDNLAIVYSWRSSFNRFNKKKDFNFISFIFLYPTVKYHSLFITIPKENPFRSLTTFIDAF